MMYNVSAVYDVQCISNLWCSLCCTAHAAWEVYYLVHCTTHGAWDSWAIWVIVQSMSYGVVIPLYNPWAMKQIYHCTAHDAWGWICSDVLYNPWCMGYMYCLSHCAIHVPWSSYTVVQSICHGVDILLCNPCSMGSQSFQMCCTTHVAWKVNLFRCVVQSMVHGYIYIVQSIVQSMSYGAVVLLYNPSAME